MKKYSYIASSVLVLIVLLVSLACLFSPPFVFLKFTDGQKSNEVEMALVDDEVVYFSELEFYQDPITNLFDYHIWNDVETWHGIWEIDIYFSNTKLVTSKKFVYQNKWLNSFKFEWVSN